MATNGEIMKDKGTQIELKGKKFFLKFDLNALCELQDHFGSLQDAFSSTNLQDFKKIRKLLHIAMANGEQEDITEKEVGALIEFNNIHFIADKLVESLQNDTKTEEETGK